MLDHMYGFYYVYAILFHIICPSTFLHLSLLPLFLRSSALLFRLSSAVSPSNMLYPFGCELLDGCVF